MENSKTWLDRQAKLDDQVKSSTEHLCEPSDRVYSPVGLYSPVRNQAYTQSKLLFLVSKYEMYIADSTRIKVVIMIIIIVIIFSLD